MSNSYGFDFLRSEHLLDNDGQPVAPHADVTLSADDWNEHDVDTPTDREAETARLHQAAQHKPDLEKQFDILAFLQKHRGSGCLAPSVIYRATGIDLDVHIKVADMLRNNRKVRIELVPDPENPAITMETFAYQAKYSNIRDKPSLLAQINRMTTGVPMRDLLDSYLTVEDDIQQLITAGDIIAVVNTEDKDKILYPRGDAFLVELDGLISLPALPAVEVVEVAMVLDGEMNGVHHEETNRHDMSSGQQPLAASSMDMPPPPAVLRPPEIKMVDTDVDPRNQVRRGEAIQVGGQWFRVSSAVKDGPLSEQPARAQAPLSVVSLIDLSKRNDVDGYIRPLTAKTLPLDGALSEAAQQNVLAAKKARERLLKMAHGRSGGVAGQLLGSYAHASNPTSLASSFAGSAASSMRNKRPISKISSASSDQSSTNHGHNNNMVKKEDLEKAAADPSLALFCHARRHGCTRDVRDMYLATRELVPESDHDLHKLLLDHKLLEPGEQLRRPRLSKSSNMDNDGKPKKRRYYERKNQRMTNTHLEGTEIGAVLALAAEKQKQGKSVGDGGM
jgi:hypothetical protein